MEAPSKKVCIITGANTGLGFETARQLVATGKYFVIMGCRDAKRAETAVNSIRSSTKCNDIESMSIDLNSLSAVESFVKQFKKRNWPLHVLILNAGILPIGSKAELTDDGFEKTFAVNYLGHFLLTCGLINELKKGAPSRVVAVSSLTHTQCCKFDYEDLNLKTSWSRTAAYVQSKAMCVAFAFELQRRYSHLGIYANALEPGLVASDILREANWFIKNAGTAWLRIFGRNIEQAAYTPVYLASSPELEGVGGKFFKPYWSKCTETSAGELCYDPHVGQKLWAASAKLVKLNDRFGDIDAMARISDLKGVPERTYKAKTDLLLIVPFTLGGILLVVLLGFFIQRFIL